MLNYAIGCTVGRYPPDRPKSIPAPLAERHNPLLERERTLDVTVERALSDRPSTGLRRLGSWRQIGHQPRWFEPTARSAGTSGPGLSLGSPSRSASQAYYPDGERPARAAR